MDGVTGAIVTRSRCRLRPSARASRASSCSPPTGADGRLRADHQTPVAQSLAADLAPGEVYLNAQSAPSSRVGRASVVIYAGGTPSRARVRDVVDFDGAGTADAALLVPLAAAQQLFGQPGSRSSPCSCRTAATPSAAPLTGPGVDALRRSSRARPRGRAGEARRDRGRGRGRRRVHAIFTTFGTFSIAAGILLIFLIFVMLAAERRGELGIARAVGTRRAHLVQMFVFEGAAYDLVAAVVGARLGRSSRSGW